MSRRPLVAIGLLEALFPGRIVAVGERLAFENPDRVRLRSWTIPIARLEGLLFALLALWGPPRGARRLLVLAGVPMALFPSQTLAVALGTAYENGSEIEVRPWVRPATRLLGAVYLLSALAGRAEAPNETGTL